MRQLQIIKRIAKTRAISRAGFTLIEMLVVVAIIGIFFSVALPVTYSFYESYMASLEAQRVMALASSLRREAFLYGMKRKLEARDGMLYVDGERAAGYENVKAWGPEGGVVFYRNGTTRGGALTLETMGRKFALTITGPLGGLEIKATQ